MATHNTSDNEPYEVSNEKRTQNDVSDEDWAIRLGFAIHDASRLRRVVYDTGLKPAGVTRSQGWVLAYLSREDGQPQSELAAELDLGKVALGGLVDRLEASGMVERKPDAQDRRVKRIFLTSKGRRVATKQRKIARTLNADIMDGVSSQDIRTTARTLHHLIKNLRRMSAGIDID